MYGSICTRYISPPLYSHFPLICDLPVQYKLYVELEKLNLKYCFVIHMKEWYTVYDQYRRTNCVASDLIMGNDYVFRVFAINLVGLSLEPCNTKDSAYIQKTGGLIYN